MQHIQQDKYFREKKQVEFYNRNIVKIMNLALQNENKIGYVEVYADNDFNIMEDTLEFKIGKFKKKEFTPLREFKVLNPELIIDACYIYFEILWHYDKTKWQVKQLILSGVYKRC